MRLRCFAIASLAVLSMASAFTVMAQNSSCNVSGATIKSDTLGNCKPTPITLRWSVTATCNYGCGQSSITSSSPQKVVTQQCSPVCNIDYLWDNQVIPVGSNVAPQSYNYLTSVRKFEGPSCAGRVDEETEIRCSRCPSCGGQGPGGAQNEDVPDPHPDPLLISVADADYPLSSFEQGVKFDLNADGEPERTAWTLQGSDEAFLVLDRNFNGEIDDAMEVFGDKTAQLPSDNPNGFRALEIFDDTLNGGNGDGKIDASDEIYYSLQLWTDLDHNGKSNAKELRGLDGLVDAIHLDYERSDLIDEHGHQFRYRAAIDRPPGSQGSSTAWNVFFANSPSTTRH